MVHGLESLKIKAKLLQKAKAKAGKVIPLKEAFEIIAEAQGFNSWRELKEVYEASSLFCPRGSTAHWKVWYATYLEASAHNKANGGYLLPFGKQFFVCETSYLEFLGLDKDDEDLKKVGCDWVDPKDSDAYSRLLAKIRRAAK